MPQPIGKPKYYYYQQTILPYITVVVKFEQCTIVVLLIYKSGAKHPSS